MIKFEYEGGGAWLIITLSKIPISFTNVWVNFISDCQNFPPTRIYKLVMINFHENYDQNYLYHLYLHHHQLSLSCLKINLCFKFKVIQYE